MSSPITFFVNGVEHTVPVSGRERLLDVLRGRLGLTGTKEGCGEGECGACTVLVDGRAVNACLYPAMEVEGRRVVTIEGLRRGQELSPLQRAFVDGGGIQCGFCSPGMILAATALLDANPDPTEREIRDALRGNLCRCTGYTQIVGSIREAVARSKPAGAKGGPRG